MKEFLVNLEGGILLGALFALVVLRAAVVVAEVSGAWKVWRTKRHSTALSLLACIAIIVGGTKPPRVSVSWDDYFTAPRSATVDTNDLRRIDLAWDVAQGVPNIATATLSAIEAHTVNPDPSSNRLFTVATVPMTNRALSVIMPTEATNYLYWMECSFIPDANVITNGVYHLRCVGGDDVWVPIGISVYDNGRQLSPPESYLYDLTD